MLAYQSPTTPFGRRPLSLAHVAAQLVASSRPPDKVVHKWKVFRALCKARPRLGVSERSLTVLDALLSFYPETTLSGDDLIVFPSNEQLSLRAHGMTGTTLRRHLAGLVGAGVIIRRDSPNGKRYARKGRGGAISHAFGFDLSPLVARADEFEALAAEIEAEARAFKFARERVTLCRRDIAKMIATGIEEAVPTRRGGQGPADWQEVHSSFRTVVEGVPRAATLQQLEEAAEALSQLADDIGALLKNQVNAEKVVGSASQNGRHIHNSNPEPPIDFENAAEESQAAPPAPEPARRAEPVSLGDVRTACPDIEDYAKGGISNWRDLLAAASVVRSALGVSPSAWEEAQTAMGEKPAAIVIAAILQKGQKITSAGGYLRQLTRKAEANEFSVGPMIMALLKTRGQAQTPCRKIRERG